MEGGTMTQLAQRTSLVFVLLLASVGTASAECAWVLWSHSVSVLPPGEYPERWGRLMALQTRRECDEYARLGVKGFVEKAANPLVKGDGNMLFIVDELPKPRAIQQITYECWPDTIDPRGPKGK